MPAALSRFGTLTEFDTLAEFDKVAEYSFGSLPMVELSSSINILLSGLSLARYKITADILMTFAGGFFAEEIEDRVAIMFVVQIEVSFVSTRRESDKPEKINISVLSGCCL